MIKQIGLEQKWLPSEIGSLFIDGYDYLSIRYWYDAVYKMLKELTQKKKQ